jgi:hypothetical protein
VSSGIVICFSLIKSFADDDAVAIDDNRPDRDIAGGSGSVSYLKRQAHELLVILHSQTL